jgi:hypothetical protein
MLGNFDMDSSQIVTLEDPAANTNANNKDYSLASSLGGLTRNLAGARKMQSNLDNNTKLSM